MYGGRFVKKNLSYKQYIIYVFRKPDKGIQFLCQCGFVEENPHAVARFLITRKGLSKQMIGEYLGNLQNEFNMAVLE
jgi:IQ motif/SEC7 domain-containing protein